MTIRVKHKSVVMINDAGNAQRFCAHLNKRYPHANATYRASGDLWKVETDLATATLTNELRGRTDQALFPI